MTTIIVELVALVLGLAGLGTYFEGTNYGDENTVELIAAGLEAAALLVIIAACYW